jgi:hypothetical protein
MAAGHADGPDSTDGHLHIVSSLLTTFFSLKQRDKQKSVSSVSGVSSQSFGNAMKRAAALRWNI